MSAECRKRAAFHGEEEVEQAILALGPHGKKKLEAAAWTLILRLGLDMVGRDHEDLLAEAFARTLSADRAWKQGIDFVRHLTETMRSISWTWRERQDAEEQAGKAEPWEETLRPPGDDAAGLLPPELYALEPDVETRLIVDEDLRALRRYLADDRRATEVIACWELGMDGPEIRARTGMSEKELRAAIRRIRRHAQRRGALSPGALSPGAVSPGASDAH